MRREFIDDEVIIEGGDAVGLRVGALTYDWPSENSPAWWRTQLAQNPSLEAQLASAWRTFRTSPGRLQTRSGQEAVGKEYLILLMTWEQALVQKGLPRSAKAQYIQFATPFYANAYPLEASTGLPIRPAGTEGISGIEEMFGGPVSNAIQAHEFDGIALGYSLSVVESARQGVEVGAPDVGIVTIIARTGIGAVGIGVSLSGIAFANTHKDEAAAAFAAAFRS